MLIVRNDQMDVFGDYMRKQFEDLMVGHLNAHYPKECETLGEKDLRETIRYGIERAKAYHVDIERDVSRYINLMFAFGRDFDKDENFPWASKILMNHDLKSTHKMDLLYEEAATHIPASDKTR